MSQPRRGRPPRSQKYYGHIVAAEDRIADALPDCIDNMLLLARGVFLEEEGKDGARRVYREPPDRQANEYLINRILGKPTERHEHGGDGDGEDAASILAVLLRALAGHPEARNIAAAALMGPAGAEATSTDEPAPDEPDDAAIAGDGPGPVADHGAAGV